jgi:uroporphyrinogen-III synthase
VTARSVRETPPSSAALVGKRVVVTRAPEQAGELCRALEARGAAAIRCPTIRLAEPGSWLEVDAALQRVDGYDWLVFASPNGVRFTLGRLDALGIRSEAPRGPRVAAVGPRTAEALVERGFEVAFVAPDEGSVPLAKALAHVKGASILMLRSDRADPTAAGILRRRGARNVDEVVAYRTVPTAPEARALQRLRRGFDGITFTSPSTVAGFLAIGPEWHSVAAGAIVASLGPATTAAARDAGLVVQEALERTMSGLVDALEAGFALGAAGADGFESPEGTAP